MNKYNEIVIVYEVLQREYENALLLKAEFEKRGYKVIIQYKMDYIFKRLNAIFVVPNSYNTKDIDSYRYSLNNNNNPMVSLQYEQVFTERTDNLGIGDLFGKAKDIDTICWGKYKKEKLIKKDVNEDKLHVCGAIQLDFLRKEFSNYYLPKSEIAKKYKIDELKRWVLFISDFTSDNNPVIVKYNNNTDSDGLWKQFFDYECRSRDEILSWFTKIVNENEEIVLIYRKHPVEKENILVDELAKKYPNRFYNICEFNIKQWIKVCDVVTTWFSTSVAETYAAKKPFYLLRPYRANPYTDMSFYVNEEGIENYDEFKCSIDKDSVKKAFIFDYEKLRKYYSIEEEPAFIRITNVIENIVMNRKYKYEESFRIKRVKYLIENMRIIKYIIKNIYQFLYINYGFSIKSNFLRNKYFIRDWETIAKHKKEESDQKRYLIIKGIINNFNSN